MGRRRGLITVTAVSKRKEIARSAGMRDTIEAEAGKIEPWKRIRAKDDLNFKNTKNMAAAPYIPARDADFQNWFLNFKTLIAANPTDYGLIAGDATIITASYTAWNAAWVTASTPATRTTPAIAAKDAARVSAEATVRPYAQQISRNQGLDPALITGLDLNLPNPTRPPVPAPATQPTLTLVSATFLRHQIAYKDASLGATKKKPTGSVAMEVWRSIGTVAATDPAQCSFYQLWTKSPNVSEFGAGDSGKKCTYFARYVTRSGPAGTAQAGPWSDALVVTVV